MFLKIPPLIIDEQDDYWILDEDLLYKTISGVNILIKAGFRTNLASIPRLLRRAFNVNGKSRAPAIVHDFLYDSQGEFEDGDKQIKYTRRQCDVVFLQAMKEKGVSLIERELMYSGVRIGGWVAWYKFYDKVKNYWRGYVK